MNDEVIKPIAKVWGVTLGAISLTLSNILTVAQIAAVVIAAAYTLWQWRRAKNKADKEDNETNH